jgi:NAD(P)-dependent dehydrogenase (short-subunit alcohol dehydrogenase family)
MTKIILVTGGNRGIGKEICRQLDRMDHKVILCSRDLSKGKKAAKEMSPKVDVQELDVLDEKSIRKLEKHIASTYGKLDVLINNAGIISEDSSVVDSDPSDYRKVMETNFYGPWEMIKAFVPLLQKSKDGRIINVSSQMGELSDLKRGGRAAYRMSKAALNALTIQLSGELPTIKVNAMHPGWVKTDMGGKDAQREVDKGAESAVWLSVNEEIPNGCFIIDKKVKKW